MFKFQMGRLCSLVLIVLSISEIGRTNEERGGPLDTCEENDQLVADEYSCTRYHVCRQMEGTDEFTTDIAICSSTKIFDMVTSECVDSATGFLQDPAGCNTFYGCHPTKETSEGFLRRHYTCPGDLRFNPEEKHCTFKTNVTDDLCNSRDPDQRIIGDLQRIRESGFVIRSNSDGSLILNPPSNIRLSNQPSPLTRFTQNTLVNKSVKPGNQGSQSSATANLNHIAQVISGQLLSLHNRVVPIPPVIKDSKDDKKNEIKVDKVPEKLNATEVKTDEKKDM